MSCRLIRLKLPLVIIVVFISLLSIYHAKSDESQGCKAELTDEYLAGYILRLYTGCQSVSALCSRSLGSYISLSLEQLPPTSQSTVAFCRTLVVAHCGPVPMTCGSCSCREHITNSVTGVSVLPVLDCGTIFHPDYGGQDCTSDNFLKSCLFGDRSSW